MIMTDTLLITIIITCILITEIWCIYQINKIKKDLKRVHGLATRNYSLGQFLIGAFRDVQRRLNKYDR